MPQVRHPEQGNLLLQPYWAKQPCYIAKVNKTNVQGGWQALRGGPGVGDSRCVQVL